MIISGTKARRPDCVYMHSLVVECLADGILGVKHGVAAFVIHPLECYYNAAIFCSLVDGVLVVRDSTELRVWQLRISGSSFRRKNNRTYTTRYDLFV